jgi:cytochrome b
VEDGELLDELLTYRVAHSVVQAWGDALGTGAWYYVGVVSAAAVIGPQVHPDVEPWDELRLLLCVLQVLRLCLGRITAELLARFLAYTFPRAHLRARLRQRPQRGDQALG